MKNRLPRRPDVTKIIAIDPPPSDGEQRLIRSENCIGIGGNADDHKRSTETIIRFEEGIRKSGKNINDISTPEIDDRWRDAIERTGR